MSIGFQGRRGKAAASAAMAALAVLGLAGAARAEAARLYYERSVMLAADARCGLFDAPTTQALRAGALQARGAALEAGGAEAEMRAVHARADRAAASADCEGQDMLTAAERVRQGFAGWARTSRMTFAGSDGADWIADRTRRAHDSWRLRQEGGFRGAHAAFGLIAAPTGEITPAAVVSFPGRPRPYAVRVVMRDPARAQRPWVVQASLSPLPPVSARRAFWATSSTAAPSGLLTTNRRQGEAWRFGPEVMDALAQLDRRERFTVEFLFRDDSVMRVHMQAGDLPAARAFAEMGPL